MKNNLLNSDIIKRLDLSDLNQQLTRHDIFQCIRKLDPYLSDIETNKACRFIMRGRDTVAGRVLLKVIDCEPDNESQDTQWLKSQMAKMYVCLSRENGISSLSSQFEVFYKKIYI